VSLLPPSSEKNGEHRLRGSCPLDETRMLLDDGSQRLGDVVTRWMKGGGGGGESRVDDTLATRQNVNGGKEMSGACRTLH
jgi:hypothetical protein